MRLVECASELSEGIFIAKEIAKMTGGLDMLGKGREEKLRSFGEIAVLARTHRQLNAIERCLRHDDIPCVSSAKTDFLEAPEVSGTLAFFASLLPRMKKLWRAQRNSSVRKIWKRLQMRSCPISKADRAKWLALWRERMHLSSAAFESLVAAAHYADMREFLDATFLGREGDVLVTEGNAAAGAVRYDSCTAQRDWNFPSCSSRG